MIWSASCSYSATPKPHPHHCRGDWILDPRCWMLSTNRYRLAHTGNVLVNVLLSSYLAWTLFFSLRIFGLLQDNLPSPLIRAGTPDTLPPATRACLLLQMPFFVKKELGSGDSDMWRLDVIVHVIVHVARLRLLAVLDNLLCPLAF